MSLGMGIPLLLVGLGVVNISTEGWHVDDASSKPHSGVDFLGCGNCFVSRIVSENASVLYLWAVLWYCLFAVHLSPFQSGSNGWEKTRQALHDSISYTGAL